MALVWTEEQQLLREVSRTFLDENAPIGELRRILGSDRLLSAGALRTWPPPGRPISGGLPSCQLPST